MKKLKSKKVKKLIATAVAKFLTKKKNARLFQGPPGLMGPKGDCGLTGPQGLTGKDGRDGDGCSCQCSSAGGTK